MGQQVKYTCHQAFGPEFEPQNPQCEKEWILTSVMSSSFLTTCSLLHPSNHSFSITPEALVLVPWDVET